jgi:hypothetical protein
MLNQTRAHPGIARESKFEGPGISRYEPDPPKALEAAQAEARSQPVVA